MHTCNNNRLDTTGKQGMQKCAVDYTKIKRVYIIIIITKQYYRYHITYLQCFRHVPFDALNVFEFWYFQRLYYHLAKLQTLCNYSKLMIMRSMTSLYIM